ncbi:class I SAM-dependent DNA methyltransferase [Siculibacillus lacustris]|uniref:site-specific DNA-methyltransferase (adenine-specific) n=1 Tax=Siculibacillus lacustris TaxID=1549641 RepID=A0A4Q9VE54_9HYPH|nr:DNA methyltransferase [Siculibacillus lacustris]TBW32927.1 class I SAM-dependent DNA methyltransferase [Siculibacillus lacustris]
MDTNALKTFAKDARRSLIAQIGAKLTHVLAEGSPERRENPSAIGTLEALVKEQGKEQVVEKVSYTWFNRLSALRFMDANGYNAIKVVSPSDSGTRPEILTEAIDGNTDKELSERTKERVQAILSGREASKDPHGEAYRLLLVATCNKLNTVMPFMFERIADYTELLLPTDLLSSDGIASQLRNVMTVDACKDVEVIGWLYQFYISEKKDDVFDGLKKNIKITAENIPAATQLFTPHWIVRYLVENSLGRLWLLNHPSSALAKKMDYYITPEDTETDFLRISSPEEIRICDPACGSGHMLTYAFDLLHVIYEEEGYDTNDIPGLILANNLTGIEIDDRAGALAAFALAMKAAQYLGWDKFQRMTAQPNARFAESGQPFR